MYVFVNTELINKVYKETFVSVANKTYVFDTLLNVSLDGTKTQLTFAVS